MKLSSTELPSNTMLNCNRCPRWLFASGLFAVASGGHVCLRMETHVTVTNYVSCDRAI